jgi:hypothetical protein
MERQFNKLRADGFATLTIIDLDHVKKISDVCNQAPATSSDINQLPPRSNRGGLRFCKCAKFIKTLGTR